MATELQLLSCSVNWFRSHSCQKLHTPWKLHESAHTFELIRQHSDLVDKIKASVAADYKRQKDNILDKRTRGA